ncbi:MAG: hypothetical protein QXV22_03555 [Thermoplasmataceae archaeon]
MGLCLELRIEGEPEYLNLLAKALSPDNGSDIETTVDSNSILFKISNVRPASLYSLPEEIIRCYEIVKKIGSLS